jgi:hypothetical protein
MKDRGGQKPETGELLPSALDAGITRSSVTGLSNRNNVHKPVAATLLLARFHRVIPPRPSAAAGCAACES